MGEAVGQQAGRNRERGATRPQDTEGLQEAELGESTPKAPGNSHFTRLVAAKGLRAVLYRCRMEHSMKQSSLAQICWGEKRHCPVYRGEVQLAGAFGPRSM